jgi:hypothetical protein
VGDVAASLTLLAGQLEGRLRTAGALLPLREQILARITDRATESRFPLTPQRIVHDVRQVMPEDGLAPTLEAVFQAGGVDLVTVPIDYSENVRVLVDELKNRVPLEMAQE